MNPSIYFHEAAERELVAQWNGTKPEATALLLHFLNEIGPTIERLQSSTQQFPQLVGPARRALLSRFPYGVIFRETSRGIEVLALAHASRSPGYWRDRLSTQ